VAVAVVVVTVVEVAASQEGTESRIDLVEAEVRARGRNLSKEVNLAEHGRICSFNSRRMEG